MAKTRFGTATHAIPVHRGIAMRPTFAAAGMHRVDAAAGEHFAEAMLTHGLPVGRRRRRARPIFPRRWSAEQASTELVASESASPVQ
jgi:hypothetical protein